MLRVGRLSARVFWGLITCAAIALASPVWAAKPTPDGVIDLLKQGNARFYSEQAIHPNIGSARLKQAGTENQGDHAVATVITCSDSRVPVELIFDMGVMDIFVVRVAGNVSNTDEIGSIEYGLAHVNTPLLVVMGHTQCGAVTAVTNQIQGHGHALERNIPPLVAPIIPAVEKAIHDHPDAKGKAVIPYAIEQNVWQGIRDLFMKSPASRDIVKSGKAKVVGAIYDVGTGRVKWLPMEKTSQILAEVEADPARAMNPMAGAGHGPDETGKRAAQVHKESIGHGAVQTSTAAGSHGAGVSEADKMAAHAIVQKITTSASHAETAYQPQIKMASHSWQNWRVHLFWALALAASLVMLLISARVTEANGNSNFRLGLGARITMGFAVVTLMLAGISGYGVITMVGIGGEIEEVAEEIIPLTDAVGKIKINQHEQALALERTFRYGKQTGEHIKKKLEMIEDQFHSLSKIVDEEIAITVKKVEGTAARSEKELNHLAKIAKTLVSIQAHHHQWEQLSDAAIDLIHEGKHNQALLLEEEVEKAEKELDHETGAFLLDMQKLLKESANKMEDDEHFAATVILIVAVAGTVIALLLAFVLTRKITKPIIKVISGLSDGAMQVAGASSQVADAGQTLANGASEQASSMEETSAALEEVSSMIKSNKDNAVQADTMMGVVVGVVEKSNKSMTDLRKAMERINATSDETVKIIKTIDEIAFQTNLLALNAAVEAARAGEAGSGFAVVADEVRSLAMRAAEAAHNTSNLIENNIKELKNCTVLVHDTDENFQEVVEHAVKVGSLVGDIASASVEQAQGIEQVNTATIEIDKVTQSIANNAEESAAAAEELNTQAETMQGHVNDLESLVTGVKNVYQRQIGKADSQNLLPLK